jgi:hypothetical protein
LEEIVGKDSASEYELEMKALSVVEINDEEDEAA